MEKVTTQAELSSVQRLHNCGLRPTPQRVAVFSFLANCTSHPTVEMVYADLISGYPTLSRTTVYQTLDALCRRGLVTKVVVEDGEMRFEVTHSHHAHFKCTQCGAIYDIFYPETTVFPAPPEKFEVKETHLYYKGICARCQAPAS